MTENERQCRKCGTTEGVIINKKECCHFYFDLCIPCDQKYFAFLTEQTQKWLDEKESNQSKTIPFDLPENFKWTPEIEDKINKIIKEQNQSSTPIDINCEECNFWDKEKVKCLSDAGHLVKEGKKGVECSSYQFSTTNKRIPDCYLCGIPAAEKCQGDCEKWFCLTHLVEHDCEDCQSSTTQEEK